MARLRCSYCKKCKAEREFSFKDATRTVRKKTCKDCRAIQDSRPHVKARAAARRCELRTQARQDILAFLGGSCAKCGYDADWRAMCIDHKNGDGHIERGYTAANALYPLIRLEPHRYQVLCANCNQIKAYENGEWRKGCR